MAGRRTPNGKGEARPREQQNPEVNRTVRLARRLPENVAVSAKIALESVTMPFENSLSTVHGLGGGSGAPGDGDGEGDDIGAF